jgi:hypothetical protein
MNNSIQKNKVNTQVTQKISLFIIEDAITTVLILLISIINNLFFENFAILYSY